jgi:hypothetical protein
MNADDLCGLCSSAVGGISSLGSFSRKSFEKSLFLAMH